MGYKNSKHLFKHFYVLTWSVLQTLIHSLHNNSRREALSLTPVYRWRNPHPNPRHRDARKPPMVTKSVWTETGFKPRQCDPWPGCLNDCAVISLMRNLLSILSRVFNLLYGEIQGGKSMGFQIKNSKLLSSHSTDHLVSNLEVNSKMDSEVISQIMIVLLFLWTSKIN